MIETVHNPSMYNHSERKENTMEGNLILKLGAEVAKHAYQNRQFREISTQNQRLMEMVHQYRMLNYTEHFYTGMTLLDETLRSQNEAVYRQNLHSANVHFGLHLYGFMHPPSPFKPFSIAGKAVNEML